MKGLSKEEFEIYCLFVAANADFNISKQELIAMGAHTDPVTFVRIYNGFEADSDVERLDTIRECKELYIKDELDRQNLFDRMKMVFFADGRYAAAEQSVFTMLRKLI
ncbi:MAG: hypothetical protein SPK72_05420 [Bacteroidales bacterium]|jgi:hypothetical protein|nr:hypothetical protein [Bacteroidales bacterium]